MSAELQLTQDELKSLVEYFEILIEIEARTKREAKAAQ